MAKKPLNKSVIKKLSPEQKQLQENIANQIMDLKLDALYNIEKQDINYGKNKSHSWKDIGFSVSDAKSHIKTRITNSVEITSNRIFDKSGYSIEVRSLLKTGDKPGKIVAGNTIIALSNSTKRDENGYIKHDENTEIAYIKLSDPSVEIIIPNHISKENSINTFDQNASVRMVSILDGKSLIQKNLEISSNEWIEKLSNNLNKINPVFPALFESLIYNREKPFVDAQPDNTTILQDIMNRKKEEMNSALKKGVTTENIKKTRGFFGKLLEKDKEKESEVR